MTKILACIILGLNETWKILQNGNVCQGKDCLNQRTAGVMLQDEFKEQQQSKVLRTLTKHFNTSVQKLI